MHFFAARISASSNFVHRVDQNSIKQDTDTLVRSDSMGKHQLYVISAVYKTIVGRSNDFSSFGPENIALECFDRTVY